jgi:hypothetical protein
MMTKGFNIITWIDVFFPQTIVSTPLDVKERFLIGQTGDRYYPSSWFSLFPQFPWRGKKLLPSPSPLVDAYKKGSALPYLCQYGYGRTFLKRAVEAIEYPFFDSESDAGKDGKFLVMDFRHLENYEYKTDYEAYGGCGLFKVIETEREGNQLKVVWIMEPRIPVKIKFDKDNGSFRRAESMLISTIYFSCVAGKHLVS